MPAPTPSRPVPTTRALGPDFEAPVDDRYFEDYVEGSARRRPITLQRSASGGR